MSDHSTLPDLNSLSAKLGQLIRSNELKITGKVLATARGHLHQLAEKEPAFGSRYEHVAELRNELRFGSTSAGRAVVGADRGATPSQLVSDDASVSRLGQFIDKLNYPQGKLLRAQLQLGFGHSPSLAVSVGSGSAIATRKSKIADP